MAIRLRTVYLCECGHPVFYRTYGPMQGFPYPCRGAGPIPCACVHHREAEGEILWGTDGRGKDYKAN
jgi:hypothetical protein